MTTHHPGQPEASPDVEREIATEQAHVDRVYAELEKASGRARDVEADGMARGRTDRTGDVRDEELTGLFERDALVFAAARRRAMIDTQYEGLVFGRLDLGTEESTAAEREVRHIGRLGVRDDDYEPLVVDWRAPAAAAFYRATPVDPMGVVRRRVLRCRGAQVVGVEDDLMVPEAPDDIVVVGDGALMAALTRSRGRQMRDIVATIQRHQDEAIRAPSRGVTEITGGPGTGKTVVALHRAAYLLYAERRRFEHGGILVIGPSSAYTAYIERVLPSLGEESVALRALGDVVDGMTAVRLDSPEVAAVKGSLRIRRVLGRLASRAPVGAPTTFRAFVAGHAVRLDEEALRRVRSEVLRTHQHNLGAAAARAALAEAAWRTVRQGERSDFLGAFEDSRAVDEFVAAWWRPLDPREVLLTLTDTEHAYRVGRGVLSQGDAAALAASYREAVATGEWSVADVPLVDDLLARLGALPEVSREEQGFYDIEELDDLQSYGVQDVRVGLGRAPRTDTRAVLAPGDARARLMAGRIERAAAYAHVLVDEAQDLSPMQWRMVARRGRTASWTVVGDAAQASWPDLAEAGRAREEAFAGLERRMFHMDTNYRNAREIFDHARDVILPLVPDADIPDAVRETGVRPVDRVVAESLVDEARGAVETLLGEVDGSIAVIAPQRWAQRAAVLDGAGEGRVQVIDPLSTKGLEWDATVVLDPDAITEESPGGVRVLYVVLTRAAHRMHVLRPA
ncbi:AAA family ATPase [Phycicoccus sp. MAQZ13P-2]|uniref:HelD family protein n=1 Tax=Phycicoccus mangrovi TaxID=2840470 RepID=UPI001C007098|nr:UvrD-helicase domain-containing protein [Phycicoccus mangrovi]MBT9274715.1 AAA family ATPase [Phycicoccus mangrovi]